MEVVCETLCAFTRQTKVDIFVQYDTKFKSNSMRAFALHMLMWLSVDTIFNINIFT